DRGLGEGGAVRGPPPERRQGGSGNRGRGPGRQAVQAERLPREGGAARLLELRLTDLTGPVAPRAVAREEAEGKALRAGRRPRRRQHRGAVEGDDGEGEAPLAVVRGPGHRHHGADLHEVELPRHADVLPDRSRGGHPPQVDGRPGREGHGRGAGEADRGGGEGRQGEAEVTWEGLAPRGTMSTTRRTRGRSS